jgi:hypothetical protein
MNLTIKTTRLGEQITEKHVTNGRLAGTWGEDIWRSRVGAINLSQFCHLIILA